MQITMHGMRGLAQEVIHDLNETKQFVARKIQELRQCPAIFQRTVRGVLSGNPCTIPQDFFDKAFSKLEPDGRIYVAQMVEGGFFNKTYDISSVGPIRQPVGDDGLVHDWVGVDRKEEILLCQSTGGQYFCKHGSVLAAGPFYTNRNKIVHDEIGAIMLFQELTPARTAQRNRPIFWMKAPVFNELYAVRT